VEKALEAVGGEPTVSSDPETIGRCDRIILPGVGAFGDAMRNLTRSGLDKAIGDAVTAGKPILGLCLGLQLLFTESDEFGCHRGLGIIPGKVRRFEQPGLRVPHIGWNQVERLRDDPLLADIEEGTYFYFVHSYYVDPEESENALGWTEYGRPFCSMARSQKVWGAQFHPEKSQAAGRQIFRNFLNIR
jgi:glutamine amidotransferase